MFKLFFSSCEFAKAKCTNGALSIQPSSFCHHTLWAFQYFDLVNFITHSVRKLYDGAIMNCNFFYRRSLFKNCFYYFSDSWIKIKIYNLLDFFNVRKTIRGLSIVGLISSAASYTCMSIKVTEIIKYILKTRN